MKTIKIIIPLIALLLFSCEKYLEEVDYVNINSETIFDSETGCEKMVGGAYVTLRALYGKENYWDMTVVGTDLYTAGSDIRDDSWAYYRGWNSGESPDRMDAVWRELYKSLNQNNLILSKIEDVPYTTLTLKHYRKGEVLFLRAHTLYWIVETWGGVHFQTEPQVEATKIATRRPVEEFYTQIFADLKEAISLLPDVDDQTADDYGRINKQIAQAFLAKMYITRNENALAKAYADSVINYGSYALVDNWDDIFDFYNMANSEVVWAIPYSSTSNSQSELTVAGWDSDDDPTNDYYNQSALIQREGGHQGHLMFAVRYENASWGMTRALPYHRGFQRWSPTKFFIDLFNENQDQRFHGSFRDTWFCNSTAPNWPATIYLDNGTTVDVDAALVGQPMFNTDDTSIRMFKYPVDPALRGRLSPSDIAVFNPIYGYRLFDINDMYNADETVNVTQNRRQFYFPIIFKYSDPTRTVVNGVGSERSARHAFAIRISDMYLISAEASLIAGDGPGAYNGNDADLTIDFILDERARELATEDYRFFDLKRTGKLLERVRAHNPEANINDYNDVRPIPDSQLRAVTNKSEFTQNTGY